MVELSAKLARGVNSSDLWRAQGRTEANTSSFLDSLKDVMRALSRGKAPVSYTHLTLPTKRIV